MYQIARYGIMRVYHCNQYDMIDIGIIITLGVQVLVMVMVVVMMMILMVMVLVVPPILVSTVIA